MAKFSDIPQFPKSTYAVDVSLHYIKQTLEEYQGWGLNMDPDFQRDHVWTKDQQIAFLEFWFRGGVINNTIYFNCPRFTSGAVSFDKFVLVDGKQRLRAVLDFLNNKVKIFGHYYKEFKDKVGVGTTRLKFCVAELETRKEILEWYISINAGGTPHTKKEIDKVRALLDQELDNT